MAFRIDMYTKFLAGRLLSMTTQVTLKLYICERPVLLLNPFHPTRKVFIMWYSLASKLGSST